LDPKATCISLGAAFFAGARAVILAYDASGAESSDSVELSLTSWMEAAGAQLGEGGEGLAPALAPAPALALPPVVVVGLGGGNDSAEATAAASRWAASRSLRHFGDLAAAASAATLLALESGSRGVADSTGAGAGAAGDSAADAAEALGSLKCLGGGGERKEKISSSSPAAASVVAVAAVAGGRAGRE
jgi:hypothetical protein